MDLNSIDNWAKYPNVPSISNTTIRFVIIYEYIIIFTYIIRIMSSLTQADYKTVLTYYEQNIPTDKTKLKQIAEDIIAQKLCNCIKKVNATYTNEPKSIGICKNSVLKRKNLSIHKFKCAKKKAYLIGNKTRSKKLTKTGNVSIVKKTRKRKR
jgi:hypothetical protein